MIIFNKNYESVDKINLNLLDLIHRIKNIHKIFKKDFYQINQKVNKLLIIK